MRRKHDLSCSRKNEREGIGHWARRLSPWPSGGSIGGGEDRAQRHRSRNYVHGQLLGLLSGRERAAHGYRAARWISAESFSDEQVRWADEGFDGAADRRIVDAPLDRPPRPDPISREYSPR